MEIRIRNMRGSDTERIGEILFQAFNMVAAKHGYPEKMQQVEAGKSWAWALLHHGSSEMLIAEVESRVGGVCCLNPRGKMGGVGPVAVDPSFQGLRLGRRLMEALLERAAAIQSLRLIQEAFNPASFYFYYALGFVPIATLLDLYREEGAGNLQENYPEISELQADGIDALWAYDYPRSKADRRHDFAYFTRWGKVFVIKRQSVIRGFLACLPGSVSVQMGPLLAERAEDAIQLYRHASSIFLDRLCQTRIMATDQLLAEALMASGFRIYCLDNLMVRGSWRPGTCVETFGTFPEGI